MHVIGVDVGSSNVRLAIIRFGGPQNLLIDVVASHKKDISIFQDGCRFQQSSSEIWAAICECSKECLKKSSLDPSQIRAISFSATCSLVTVDAESCIQNKLDTIMWMDHRAIEEAKLISETDPNVTKQFGGICSPEFSLAKLLWLKGNEPDRFESCKSFFELPDWLVYRCIGGAINECPRSLCCLTLKWGYNPETKEHCETISKRIFDNSEDELEKKIGSKVLGPGMESGYISHAAASELGLMIHGQRLDNILDKENRDLNRSSHSGILVGTSLIDAHAGMLGMISISSEQINMVVDLDSTYCSLVGTSSCHLFLSPKSQFSPGVWGPYKDVLLKDHYLLEAGQSLVGKLIERTIETNLEGKIRLSKGDRIYEIINDLNMQIMQENHQTKLHVLPFHHGNRSPLANPRLRGGIYGMNSREGADGPSLLDLYTATVDALVYENKLILDSLGARPKCVLVSGGLMKNAYFMQTIATVLQCRVMQFEVGDIDFMVLGSGLLAKHSLTTNEPITRENVGSFRFHGLEFKENTPQDELIEYHQKRYKCFKCFVDLSLRMDQILNIENE